MSERRDKSNKKFMLLSAIGIFMVVDHHTFTAFNFLADFLPYNSFFMPMFVFISGYFNKVDNKTNLWTFFVKKIKTLLVPYTGISLSVFALQQLINYIKLGDEMTVLPSGYLTYALNRIITVGSYAAIVEPMWFVIALFVTLMVYAVLKKFLYKIWNSYIMFVIFCGFQIFVVYLAKTANPESIEYLLVPLKCLFFLPFLEMGIIYRDHLEKKHSAMSGGTKVVLMFILLAINVIRTNYMPIAYDIAVDSIDNLTGFTSPYYITPLISAVIGILFWLTFADLVGKQVYESKFINFMSCNTFWIMGLHILFYNILNCILMFISKTIVTLPYFDIEAFKGSEWYFWEISSNIKILYVMIGVLGPLAVKWIYDRISSAVNGKVEKIASKSSDGGKVLKVVFKLVFVLAFVLVVAIIVLLTSPKADGEGDYTELTDITDEDEYFNDLQSDGTVGDEHDSFGMNNETDENNQTDADLDTDQDNNPVYAYFDLAYEHNGTEADYLTNPYEIKGNGTYTVAINRTDNPETQIAFDGISYMGIRLIDDEMSDIDITEAVIKDVKVTCDGVALKVDETGSTPYENGVIYDFFDCYDMEKSTPTIYDFTGKNKIEISFTISGAKKK